MPAYKAQCSNCNASFNAPFQPSPGREILCAECLILQQDLSRHPFFIGFEAFIRTKWGTAVQAFQVTKSGGDYNVLLQLKSETSPLVAKVEFSSATGYDIPSTLPAPMIVKIITGDQHFRMLLEEFAKKIKQFTKKSGELTINLV